MYDRQITTDDQITFGVSGMLYRNGLIMYDHQTESLWSHILGQAISGRFKETQLTFIPALQTDWKSWKELHPDTQVINPRFYGRDSYEGYYASGAEGVIGRSTFGGGSDGGQAIYSKEYLLGLRLDGEARAYPFSVLNDEPVVNDQVGSIPVAVFFDKSTASATAFDRRLEEGMTLTFEPGPEPKVVQDTETQSEWNIFTGEAVSGSLAGTQLEQIPTTYAFWFGWIDYHSESTVYGIDR